MNLHLSFRDRRFWEILSPPRMPFRHPGTDVARLYYQTARPNMETSLGTRSSQIPPAQMQDSKPNPLLTPVIAKCQAASDVR